MPRLSDAYIQEVEDRCRGQWESILISLAPELEAAINARGKGVACPHHASKSKKPNGLRAFFKATPKGTTRETGGLVCNTCGVFANGFKTLMWARGWSFVEAVEAVAAHLGGVTKPRSPEEIARETRRRAQQEAKAKREIARLDSFYAKILNEVWRGTVPMTHPDAAPGRLYLANRGISKQTFSPAVRFHPALEYRDDDGKVVARLPAFVLRFQTQEGKPGSLQRLYTNQTGDKLDELEDRKKMMSHPSTAVLTGGAIALTPVAEVLGVSEGFETAEAVMELFPRLGCWALYNTTLMEGFVPPAGVKKVIVFADKDASGAGEKSARVLIERLWAMGVKAEMRLPPMPIPESSKGVDWLDFLVYRNTKLGKSQRTA